MEMLLSRWCDNVVSRLDSRFQTKRISLFSALSQGLWRRFHCFQWELSSYSIQCMFQGWYWLIFITLQITHTDTNTHHTKSHHTHSQTCVVLIYLYRSVIFRPLLLIPLSYTHTHTHTCVYFVTYQNKFLFLPPSCSCAHTHTHTHTHTSVLGLECKLTGEALPQENANCNCSTASDDCKPLPNKKKADYIALTLIIIMCVL